MGLSWTGAGQLVVHVGELSVRGVEVGRGAEVVLHMGPRSRTLAVVHFHMTAVAAWTFTKQTNSTRQASVQC